jgi:ubiquinone/menaquinone biosynthesis C-methylase UbiE
LAQIKATLLTKTDVRPRLSQAQILSSQAQTTCLVTNLPDSLPSTLSNNVQGQMSVDRDGSITMTDQKIVYAPGHANRLVVVVEVNPVLLVLEHPGDQIILDEESAPIIGIGSSLRFDMNGWVPFLDGSYRRGGLEITQAGLRPAAGTQRLESGAILEFDGRTWLHARVMDHADTEATRPPPVRKADSKDVPSDSATYRTGYSGIKRYTGVADAETRATWQMPDLVVDSLDLSPGQRVADIGAGSGYFERLLAKAVGESGAVYAVEIEPELVQHMQERAVREETPQVRPILGTRDNPGLPDSLDLIFLCNTYRYIDGRRSYFARLRDRLNPEGRLAVVEFKRFPQDTTETRILPERVIAELNAAGYEVVQRYTFLPKQYFLIFRVRPDTGQPSSND